MNFRCILALFLFSMFAHSSDIQTIAAHGTVFYKMPTEEMVTRDVNLIVPVMGQGKMVLNAAGFSITVDRFFVEEQNGRTIFYMIFTEHPGQKPGEISIWRGTYIRGTNLARYYGDIFIGPENQDDGEVVRALESGSPDGYMYIAGFSFEAPVLDSFDDQK